jgi:hypothetical protein
MIHILTPVSESEVHDHNAQSSNSEFFRPSTFPSEGREVVFAPRQSVVMGTHPNIPNLIIIGNLGTNLPEEFIVPALSHEEIHNTLNKLGEAEKAASISCLDHIGKAVTDLDATGLAAEGVMEEGYRQFHAKRILNRMNSS